MLLLAFTESDVQFFSDLPEVAVLDRKVSGFPALYPDHKTTVTPLNPKSIVFLKPILDFEMMI